MADILFKTYEPLPLQRPYIHQIFAFETKREIKSSEAEIIAPNGELKIVIPYKNNSRSIIGGVERSLRESSIAIVGPSTHNAVIACDAHYGNLRVQFKPGGVFRFFDLPLGELTDGIVDASDLFPKKFGMDIQARIENAEGLDGKVGVLQNYLLGMMARLDRAS